MMALVRLALRRPYTIAVLSLLILLLGFLSVQRMIVDFFPKIDIPVVFVGWNYPGLSAEEMERRVVIISERAYSTTVNGIERIESYCIPGTGLVKVFFHEGADLGQAIAQINAVNGTVLRILPPGISLPVMIRFNPATVPIVQMILGSKTLSEAQIFDHTLNFVRVKLFTVPGLQTPAPFGGKFPQIQVDLNPPLMESKGVSPNDVVNALISSNLLIPAGTARLGEHRLQRHDELQPTDRGSVQSDADQGGGQGAGADRRRGQSSQLVRGPDQHRACAGPPCDLPQYPESGRRFELDGGRFGPRAIGRDPRRRARRWPRRPGYQFGFRSVGIRAGRHPQRGVRGDHRRGAGEPRWCWCSSGAGATPSS